MIHLVDTEVLATVRARYIPNAMFNWPAVPWANSPNAAASKGAMNKIRSSTEVKPYKAISVV